MAMDMERLLRLTADFHNFRMDAEVFPAEAREDELSLEDLDLIAAAGESGFLAMEEDEF